SQPAPSSNAHTYRLLIVKEPYSVSCYRCESLCSSAAEEREYAVFRDVRQVLFYFSSDFSVDLANVTS
ncbi:hypothetical protein, partial [Massilia sp. BKSP1R2A-1]|uniref:hypothetical protein n=1 Tax=Massilia sp. BKSP1R2A-1 TaxID=3422595 RepID=UPI003D3310E4